MDQGVGTVADLGGALDVDREIAALDRWIRRHTIERFGPVRQVQPEQVFELGVQADSKAAEALVLSCTDMRSVEVIAELEAKLNKPVVTSNQAMMFQAMGFLGFDDRIEGFGRLFAMITHSSEGTQKL